MIWPIDDDTAEPPRDTEHPSDSCNCGHARIVHHDESIGCTAPGCYCEGFLDPIEPDVCDCGVCEECARDREAERFATDADAAYDARHDFDGID